MGLYHHFQTTNNICGPYSFSKYAYIRYKQSYKISVNKDLMRIILPRNYEHLKLSIILYKLHVLIIFFIYQTTHYFPKKIKSPPSEFHTRFFCNDEHKAVLGFLFFADFDV